MIGRNYKLEIQIKKIGPNSWEIYGPSDKLGVVTNLASYREVEKFIRTNLQKKYPETEIAVVQRKPHIVDELYHDMMREIIPHKKRLNSGCIGIARANKVGD